MLDIEVILQILACSGGLFNERFRSSGQGLSCEIIKEAIYKIEIGQSETALQHKSKLQVYKELKGEVEFKEYLK